MWRYPLNAITPRSTLARSGSTCQGPIYGSNSLRVCLSVRVCYVNTLRARVCVCAPLFIYVPWIWNICIMYMCIWVDGAL